MMRYLLSFFTLICLLSPADVQGVTIPENKENFYIFVLMGQSNMEGACSIDGAMDTTEDPRILKLGSAGWQVAKDPITNNTDVAVGPGLTFAKKLVAENENITVGLIPLAAGGQKIVKFIKGSMLYNQALNAVGFARQQGVLKGVLWHQGEHDAIESGTAAVYANKLESLINDFRVDLGDPGIPFIVGGFANGIFMNPNHPYASWISDHLKNIGTTFYRTGYVRSSGVPYLSDNLHFSTEGQHEMGQRYADVYLRMSGHWLAKGKELLDATATVMDGGWKWSDQFGLYYDGDYTAEFPLIKHAQLGWVKIDAYADSTLSIESPIYGKFRTTTEHGENEIRIYRENLADPEDESIGDTYGVNLLATSADQGIFYNYNLGVWQQTIDDNPVLDQVDVINRVAELEYAHTQQAISDMTVATALGTTWSHMTQLLKTAELHRLYTIHFAGDAYHFANNNLSGWPREFWTEHSLELINRIDAEVIAAQDSWSAYTTALYAY
jgi:hypothetical protein